MANKKLQALLKKMMAACLTAAMLLTPVQAFAETESAETESAAGAEEEAEDAASSEEGVDAEDEATGEAETETADETSGEEGAETADEVSGEEGAAANVAITAEDKQKALEEAIVTENVKTIKNHELVAENDAIGLYLYEPTLSLIIRDKKTGAIMESTVQESDGTLNATWENFIKSGIGFDILNDVNEERTDLLSAGAQIDVTKSGDGFSAAVDLTKYEISFTLNVTLKDDGIEVEIPSESIVEAQEKVTIGNIYVYPFLGYTYSYERDGYMFVPDGNGALIYLEDNDGRFSSPLTLKVWGDNAGVDESYVLSLFWEEFQTVNDAEPVLAPVFGMVHTDSQMAMLGIIEEGAEDARIAAYPNGAITNYNWITPRFTLRRIYKQLMSKEGTSAVQLQEDKRAACDIRVRYVFTSGEEADYAGMAVKYREYLLEEQQLAAKEDDFRIRLDFLGTDRENGMIFKKPVVMTTTDNIRDIYADLKAEGVTDIFSIYKGWQDGGIWSMPVSKYKADSKIGGTSDLTKLVGEAKEAGIELYLYQDALRANPDTVNTTFNVIKKLDESVYKENTYKEIYESFNFQTTAQAVKKLNESLASYQKKGIDSLALTGMTDHLYSYSYNGKQYNRTETLQAFSDALGNAAQSFKLAMEEPLSCYWNMTESIVGMPVSTSSYIFTDEEVPFLSIALKGVRPMYAGYTNFEANKSEYFLQLVETGIHPSFYLTWEDPVDLLYTNSSDLYTSRYGVYKNEIIDYYNQLRAVSDETAGAVITDREKTDNVAVVTYSNGVKVYVNYNEKSVTCDGIALEGMSYKVVR